MYDRYTALSAPCPVKKWPPSMSIRMVLTGPERTRLYLDLQAIAIGLAALVKEFEERMYETSTQADTRFKLAAVFAGKKKSGIHCVFRNYQCRRQQ